ncbi:hypothetical protein SUGI_0920000 [Cryptomeria japonica]|nr:hypothetical protein SUGI_0920000 [Cryptomeria japonica]
MVPAEAYLAGVGEERRFHGLPPLKRFKLLQKESKTHGENANVFCLPAKKRIWAVKDFVFEQERAMKEEGEALSKYSDCAQIQIKLKKVENITSTGKKSQKQENQQDKDGEQSDCRNGKHEKMEKKWDNAKRKRLQKPQQKDFEVQNKLKKVAKSAPVCEKVQQHLKEGYAEEDDDDGVVCSVCGGHDGNPTDPIVFCDGCDVMVHASCYGDPLIKAIPDGDWFCARCMHSTAAGGTLSCCLCPSSKGAMKCTTQNSWAHISCALLVPEVFFKCPEGREMIDCSMVPARRREMICTFCNKATGACIECSEHRCPSTFHVSCGLDRDLHMEYKESKSGGIVVSFCDVHTPKWQMQQEIGKFKIVPRQPAECGKRIKDSHPTHDHNL